MNRIPPALAFDDVSFGYERNQPVLEHASFALPPGSFTAVVGPSGGGKSTILRLAIGLERPTAGRVENALRTRMVFQSGALLPWLTVMDNVRLGFADRRRSAAAEKRIARATLAELGIAAFADQYPRDLSGGQRQRVGIARALVAEPDLLLLDEPFSALDAETTARLAAEIEELFRKKSLTVLMVSHSIEDAVLLADEILVVGRRTICARVGVPVERPRARDDAHIATVAARVRGDIRRFSEHA